MSIAKHETDSFALQISSARKRATSTGFLFRHLRMTSIQIGFDRSAFVRAGNRSAVSVLER
jgi:hypothetical protein